MTPYGFKVLAPYRVSQSSNLRWWYEPQPGLERPHCQRKFDHVLPPWLESVGVGPWSVLKDRLSDDSRFESAWTALSTKGRPRVVTRSRQSFSRTYFRCSSYATSLSQRVTLCS